MRNNALLECDLILKGGISSGIVYPRAIKYLSDYYRFRSIGGASAGAMAAAAAAAAEYGRARQDSLDVPDDSSTIGPFDKLAGLPEALAETDDHNRTLLLRLFEPEDTTKTVYRWFLSGLSTNSGEDGLGPYGQAWHWLMHSIWRFPVYGIAALALSALVFTSSSSTVSQYLSSVLDECPPLPHLISSIIGLFLSAFILLIVMAGGVLDRTRAAVLANNYGLVGGMGGVKSQDALMPWLHRTIQQLAGLPPSEPLTFGDLWGASDCEPHARKIDLRVMTTCISRGQGYSFPLEPEVEFYFCAEELSRFFPNEVIAHLCDRSLGMQNAPNAEYGLPRYRLPAMSELPILFAVRLSLSFPILLSAVPLWARGGDDRLQRVWFSDGGIISNFPIHYFDALIPNRPTFGISLAEASKTPACPTPSDMVDLPSTNKIPKPASSVIDQPGEKRLLPFLGALFSAVHGWSDAAQQRVPGYRDRIATIYLGPGEGGLNLRMKPSLIRALASRGELAGKKLVRNFHPAMHAEAKRIETNWANHRWVRYRTAGNLFEEALEGLRVADLKAKELGEDLGQLHDNQPSFPMCPVQTRYARAAYDQIIELANWFKNQRSAFAKERAQTRSPDGDAEAGDGIYAGGFPKPRSRLRVLPRD